MGETILQQSRTLQNFSAIIIYEPCRNWELRRTYQDIADSTARQLNIGMVLCDELMLLKDGRLNIWQDEPLAYPVDAGSHCIYGARLLNRFDRLLIAQQCACPLPVFFAAADASEYLSDGKFILKADLSSRGAGIKFIARNSLLRSCISEGDVVMEYLGDGSTWKLDCFFDVAIGCRLTTDNPLHCMSSHSRYTDVAIPLELWDVSLRLGPALAQFGCLYYSVDFMLLDNRLVVIEINTSSVGRLNQWVEQRSLYVQNIVRGLRNFFLFGGEIGNLREFQAKVSEWRTKRNPGP